MRSENQRPIIAPIKYVIKAAEDNSDEISKLLDFRYKRKIDIIVYNNINELNQTNIGIYEQGQNPGGTVNIPENKKQAGQQEFPLVCNLVRAHPLIPFPRNIPSGRNVGDSVFQP